MSLRKATLRCQRCGVPTAKTLVMLACIDRFRCEACAGVTPVGRDLVPALKALEQSIGVLDAAIADLSNGKTLKRRTGLAA